MDLKMESAGQCAKMLATATCDDMLSPMAWSCYTAAICQSQSVEIPLLDLSKALEAACGDISFLVQ